MNMEGSIQKVKDFLNTGSTTVFKDFQEDTKIEREDETSEAHVEVFTVRSSNPAISSKHSLLIKRVENPRQQTRLKAEYEGGLFIDSVCAGHTNKPLLLKNNFLVLDEEAGYKEMWTEIAESRIDKVGIQQLALVLGRLHCNSPSSGGASLPTGNDEFVEQQKKSLFLQPYSSVQNNIEQPDYMRTALERLQNDQRVKAAVDKLSNIFTEKKDIFVHGNLSLENVMVKEGKPKLVNLPYSMTGPRGLDLGLLLASYMAQYCIHIINPDNNDAHRRVAYKMMDACSTTIQTYLDEVRTVLSDEEVKVMVSETVGFTACELIRRSVGSNPYPGLTNNPGACMEIFEAGMRLITKYESMEDFGRFLMIGLALC